MDKFPIFGTLYDSFKFIGAHRRQALAVMWPYALILIALITIMPYFPEAEDAFLIAIWPLVIIAFVMVGLPWQRIYLLGTVSGNEPRQPISRHEWVYRIIYAFFLICLVMACSFLLIMPLALPVYIHIPSFLLVPTWLVVPTSVPFIFMLICARFLPYLSALAIGNPINLKDSFRLSKGRAIRLSLVTTFTAILFSILLTVLIFTAGLWNFDEDYKAIQLAWADWLRTAGMSAERQDGMIETSAFSSTRSWIDFLLLWPTPIILGLLFSLVITGNIAQFYKWAIARQTP